MSEVKNILITTYFFYPSNTPRAFRITALAKKLSENGHSVTVVTSAVGFDYSEIEKSYNLKVITVGTKKEKLTKQSDSIKNNTRAQYTNGMKTFKSELLKHLKTSLRKSLLYFLPDGHLSRYGGQLYYKLSRLNINDYDVVISNSNPFIVHLGTALALKNFNNTSIAETGDPYFFSQYKLAFYQKYIEKWALSQFNTITVPVEKAVNDYRKFNLEKKVKVIPHGFFFDAINLKKERQKNTINFAFAGRLYKGIRNPTKLLTFLTEKNSNLNFRFTFYTDLKNKETEEILAPFIEKLGSKLVINSLLPREECIYELSGMDFLVNLVNDTNNQTPSKLVDYTLSKRPIIHIDNELSNKAELKRFMVGDYSSHKEIDINSYDINTVCKQFEQIF